MRRPSRVWTAPCPCSRVGALAIVLLACAARPPARPAARASDEIQLYRDRALIAQRIAIDVPSAGRTTVALRVAGDVGPSDVVVLELGGLAGSEVRLAPGAEPPRAIDPLAEPDLAPLEPEPPMPAGVGPIARPDDPLDVDPLDAEAAADAATEAAADAAAADAARSAPHAAAVPEPPAVPESPAVSNPPGVREPPAVLAARPASVLELVVDAPRAGRFVVALGYATRLVRWDAAYTLTTAPAHDHATVRGTLTITNATGVALHGHARVVDRALGTWSDQRADRLRAALRAPPTGRDLGDLTLAADDPRRETRIALLAGDPPRALRSVLVYDPIGPALDHPGAAPAADPDLGARTHRTTRITESLELDRDARADHALPGGTGTLIERRAGGVQVTRGTARLFDAATANARAETIAIGTAVGLIGHRERRDWAKDDDQHRFSEEFLLTIDSARPRPVEVVIREHLYRGQNWTLAYQSAPAAKEGAQQIALRAAVPANGRAKVLYVVVYTW